MTKVEILSLSLEHQKSANFEDICTAVQKALLETRAFTGIKIAPFSGATRITCELPENSGEPKRIIVQIPTCGGAIFVRRPMDAGQDTIHPHQLVATKDRSQQTIANEVVSCALRLSGTTLAVKGAQPGLAAPR